MKSIPLLNKKTFIKNILFLIAVFMLLAIGLYLFPHTHRWLSNSSHIIEQHTISLTVFRWSLITLVFIFWPVFVDLKAKAEKWTEAKKQYWLQKRFNMIMWLIIFEVLICENLLFKFFYFMIR